MKLGKMNWQKKGASGGGGGSGNSMQMLSIIMMIVSLIIGMSGQCKEEKKEQKDIYEGEKNIPGPATVTKSCNELGGFKCNPNKEQCSGDKLNANDNTYDGICYSKQGIPNEETENKTIDANLQSCASQKGFDCRLEKYCPNNQWISAKDTQTCCSIECRSRIQTTISYPILGEVVIEKLDNSFGVWYGQDPQTKTFDANIGFKAIGHPNFARARSLTNNQYEFTIEDKTYRFTLTKNEANEIEAMVS